MPLEEIDSRKEDYPEKERYNEKIKAFVLFLRNWFSLNIEEQRINNKTSYILDVDNENNSSFSILEQERGGYKLCHREHPNLVLACISIDKSGGQKLDIYHNNLDRLHQLIGAPAIPLRGSLLFNKQTKNHDKRDRNSRGLERVKKNNRWIIASDIQKVSNSIKTLGLELAHIADGTGFNYTLTFKSARDFYIYTDSNRRWLFHRELLGVPIAVEEQARSSPTELVVFLTSIEELKKCLQKRMVFQIPEELKDSQKEKDFINLIIKTINSETKFTEENGQYILSTTDTEFVLEGLTNEKSLFFVFPFKSLAQVTNGILSISDEEHDEIRSLLDEQVFTFSHSDKAKTFAELLEDKYFLKGKIVFNETEGEYTLNALGTDFIVKNCSNGERLLICKFGSIYPVAKITTSGNEELNIHMLTEIIENMDLYQLSRMRSFSTRYLEQASEKSEIESFWKKSDLWASTRRAIIIYVLQRMDKPEFITTAGQLFCCCTPSKTSKFQALNLLFQGKTLNRRDLLILSNMGYLRDLLRDVIMDANNIHHFYPSNQHLTIVDLLEAMGYKYDQRSQSYLIEAEAVEEEKDLAVDVSILAEGSSTPGIKSPLPRLMSPYKTPFKSQPKGLFQYFRQNGTPKTPLEASFDSLREIPEGVTVDDHVWACVQNWARVEEQRLKLPRRQTPKKSFMTRRYDEARVSIAQFSQWYNSGKSAEGLSSSQEMTHVVRASNSDLKQPLI